jgi:hypothetical protein
MAEPLCLACRSSDVAHWATARDVEYLSVDESFDYVRCRQCDTLSIAEPPLDRLGEIYPDTYYSFDPGSAGFVERVKQRLDRRMFRKLLTGIPGNELAALDVGGGTGWLLIPRWSTSTAKRKRAPRRSAMLSISAASRRSIPTASST